MNKVQSRVTWWDNFQDGSRDYEVTLDNTEEEYRFAFTVSMSDFLNLTEAMLRERIVKASNVLKADYERRHENTH